MRRPPALPDARLLTRRVSEFFRRRGRALPWRSLPRDPYHALVAEAMLQQTQVARVIDYFERFVVRFASVQALAAANEDEVLALWSGLGYYRRARHLHAAARLIVDQHAGQVPADVVGLMSLPGIGRYTAGSIASIVFDRPEPIVDGNVMRVLLRVHGRGVNPVRPATVRWAWTEAERLVRSAARPGQFNEGLMELGATVCRPPPTAPRCGACPLRAVCVANAEGLQSRIPRPKRPAVPKTMYCASVVLMDRRGRVLLERRPSTGMWANMWQAPSVESQRGPVPLALLARRLGWPALRTVFLGGFTHKTSHRTMEFVVLRASAAVRVRRKPGWRWCSTVDAARLAISNAQRRVLTIGAQARA